MHGEEHQLELEVQRMQLLRDEQREQRKVQLLRPNRHTDGDHQQHLVQGLPAGFVLLQSVGLHSRVSTRDAGLLRSVELSTGDEVEEHRRHNDNQQSAGQSGDRHLQMSAGQMLTGQLLFGLCRSAAEHLLTTVANVDSAFPRLWINLFGFEIHL